MYQWKTTIIHLFRCQIIPSSQFDLDDFNLNYLDNTTNVNQQKPFQDAFDNPSEIGSSSSVNNMAHVTVNELEDQVWNIPQLNTSQHLQ